MSVSMPAQSWLSMPPAPDLMVRIASLRSSLPDSMLRNSSTSNSASRASSLRAVSAARSSSGSCSSSSAATRRSSTWRSSFPRGSVQAWMPFSSSITASAAFLSSQKSEPAILPLRTFSRSDMDAASKTLHEPLKPFFQGGNPLVHLRYHLPNPFSRKSLRLS